MQSPGQFADWAFEKARTALWDGLGRQVSAGGEAACEAVTKAGFYPRLGYAVTKCEKGADFPGSILDAIKKIPETFSVSGIFSLLRSGDAVIPSAVLARWRFIQFMFCTSITLPEGYEVSRWHCRAWSERGGRLLDRPVAQRGPWKIARSTAVRRL